MERFVCQICGHIYDPEKGEAIQDIKPGLAFASLPADWECPVCGAKKDKFLRE
ncbi:MAG: rubredoxin [Methanoregula sp.]|jgi:rubredoxin|nr:rubredoxin [Methanoregula sp.]MDD5024420.1 rubredoxin [Methanoregula sp.]